MLGPMNDLIKKLTSRKGRIWLYSTGIAGIGVLTAYGALSGEHAAAWSALLAPLFGLALANISDDKEN